MSSREVAAMTGTPESTVRRDLRNHPKHDIVRGRDGKYYRISERAKQMTAGNVLTLRQQGLTYREIAERMHVSSATAYRLCRDYRFTDSRD